MENSNKVLILYHKEDNDGIWSGALFVNHFIHDLNYDKGNVIYHGMNYGDMNSITKKQIKEWHLKYEYLILTDISMKADLMDYAHMLFENKFIWVDHHKPIIKECERYKASSEWSGERGIDRSAILLTWKYLYDQFDIEYNQKYGNIPRLLVMLSSWDSFTYEQNGFSLMDCKAVNEGINSLFKLDIDAVCEYLHNGNIDSILDDAFKSGNFINNYQQTQNQNLIKEWGDCGWTVGDNRKACAIFLQGPTNSLIFESLKGTDIKSGIVFKYRPEKHDWVVSLYNINDKDESFHCGEYMKKYWKGGGHAGAAGGNMNQAWFRCCLRNKSL